ncbi:MAG: imelysin family protein, partial [Myxococcota bacterium]
CEAWSAAEDADADAARAAAADQWTRVMDRWQEVEVMQLGPAGSSLTTVGGEDLRDAIYSWPTVNACRVDQETVYGTWAGAGFFTDNLVTVYGLDALEVLLFSAPGEHGCPPQVDIAAAGSWDALGLDGVQQRRADYAVVVAGGVADTVDALVARWAERGFGAALAAGTAPYDGQQQALDAVFDALFYVESSVRDRKLGRPLGLADCVGEACLDEVESPIAGLSHRWVAANLRGFRALFTGGGGEGMDDLLAAVGRPELADEVLAATDAADAAAAALTVPVDAAATTDPTPAVALHDAVAALGDLLESDVATTLALTVPAEAAGDND